MCRHQSLKESKERIEARNRGDIRSGELLAPMIETASPDEVQIHGTARMRVHDGIERERPDVHVSARKSDDC